MSGGPLPGLVRHLRRPASETGDQLNAQIFVQLYSKLAATLSAHGVVGHDYPFLLSVLVPGLYIPTRMDVSKPETQYWIANTLNPTLACSWTALRGGGVVPDVYKSILDGKQTPLAKLTPEEEKELENARNFLFRAAGDPTPEYAAYLGCELSYIEALDDYEAAAATHANGGAPIPEKTKQRLKEAEDDWKKRGYRLDVERATVTIGEYEAREPQLYRHRLKERYAQYTRVADVSNEYQFVTCRPPYEQWFQEFGWSHFTFDEQDFRNQKRSGAVGIGGRRCCCECRCNRHVDTGVSAFAAFDSARPEPQTSLLRAIRADVTNVKAHCRLRRVEIERPWMDTNVFYSRAWRWSEVSLSYGVVISTGGDIAGNEVPGGVMPVLPITAILARDLEIEWDDDGGALAAEITARVAAGHEVRFGPFRLTHARVDGHHRISAPDPQLIGYLSAILPKCPNPDPTLKWPLLAPRSHGWPSDPEVEL